jgi:hypothetical protein
MIKTLPRKQVRVGPADNGRRMSLDRFDRAIAQEGYLYELNKGIIEVSDVPEPKHALQVQEFRDTLVAYRLAHPNLVTLVAGSKEAKILLDKSQTERHPDVSVYVSPVPDTPDVWSLWVPAIVVEVVSKSSTDRDYKEKPDEYLQFGVAEYWIIDAFKRQMTVLVRWGGQWKKRIVRPPQKYETRQLPGFALDLKRVLSSAK